MKTKIYKTKDVLRIEIPLKEKRLNPYIPDTDAGEINNICALIGKDECGNDRTGFAHYIVMSYKG